MYLVIGVLGEQIVWVCWKYSTNEHEQEFLFLSTLKSTPKLSTTYCTIPTLYQEEKARLASYKTAL